jgi:hypothetical protein
MNPGCLSRLFLKFVGFFSFFVTELFGGAPAGVNPPHNIYNYDYHQKLMPLSDQKILIVVQPLVFLLCNLIVYVINDVVNV